MFGEVLWRYVNRELKIRYAGSFLGPFWIVLQPLIFTLVSTLVFSFVFKGLTGEVPYLLYVLMGSVVWGYFSGGLLAATKSLIVNREIVGNAYFDWSAIVVGTVMVKLVDLVVNLTFFMIVFEWMGRSVTTTFWWLPVLMVIQTIMMIGLGLILASLNVYFRDVQNIVEICLQGLYFLTPIVYPISIVPVNLRQILQLNPMTYMVDLYRRAVFGGPIDLITMVYLAVGSTAVLMVGIKSYKKLKFKFSELL